MAVLQKKSMSPSVGPAIPANHCRWYYDIMVTWQFIGCNCNPGCAEPPEPTGPGNPGDILDLPCECGGGGGGGGGPGGPG